MTTYRLLALTLAAIYLAGCANTIRGVGRDASNTVTATKKATKKVARSVAG